MLCQAALQLTLGCLAVKFPELITPHLASLEQLVHLQQQQQRADLFETFSDARDEDTQMDEEEAAETDVVQESNGSKKDDEDEEENVKGGAKGKGKSKGKAAAKKSSAASKRSGRGKASIAADEDEDADKKDEENGETASLASSFGKSQSQEEARYLSVLRRLSPEDVQAHILSQADQLIVDRALEIMALATRSGVEAPAAGAGAAGAGTEKNGAASLFSSVSSSKVAKNVNGNEMVQVDKVLVRYDSNPFQNAKYIFASPIANVVRYFFFQPFDSAVALADAFRHHLTSSIRRAHSRSFARSGLCAFDHPTHSHPIQLACHLGGHCLGGQSRHERAGLALPGHHRIRARGVSYRAVCASHGGFFCAAGSRLATTVSRTQANVCADSDGYGARPEGDDIDSERRQLALINYLQPMVHLLCS